jgi:hypothetical protein
MGKDSTIKTVLIVGGVGLGVYLLANSSARKQIEDAIKDITGNLPAGGGGGGGFGDISFPGLPSFTLPSFEMPAIDLSNLLGGLDTTAGLGGMGDILADLSDLLKPSTGSTPEIKEHATAFDVMYSMPSWAKGTIGVSAGLLGGYGGYQAIKVTAPILRTLGTQTARAIGGAGDILGNLLRPAAGKIAQPLGTKLVPIAAKAATKGATGGLFAGFLPGLALTGIVEGAYQIFRSFSGASNVGMTGVPPIDIINFIRGTFKPGGGAFGTPQPSSLFDALFGGLFKTAGAAEPAAGGTPGTVAPAAREWIAPSGPGGADLDYSYCEAYNAPLPAEVKAKPKKDVPVMPTIPKSAGGGGGSGTRPLMT